MSITIDCISDLHGYFPELPGGDILIVAGDLTASDKYSEYMDFFDWLNSQQYKKKIIIAGNHDNQIFYRTFIPDNDEYAEYLDVIDDAMDYSNTSYLCDSGTEFEGLKIWGSPWSLKFEGMNPACMAFTCDTEEELADKFSLIPDDVDILVTHGPPKYGLDRTIDDRFVGSESLRDWVFTHQPKLHIFGHIHESYGIITSQTIQDLDFQITGKVNDKLCKTSLVNASHVNEYYEPVNKPVRVIL